MAHAYYVTGEGEQGIDSALSFAEQTLNLSRQGNPDVIVLRHGLFAVEDARKLMDTCMGSPVAGEHKAVIVSITRIFHEAQNALLKLFEEPPKGVTLILVLPAEGLLLPTLRSRLTELPNASDEGDNRKKQKGIGELAQTFLDADDAEREKLLAKLLDRTKSDKDEEKQRARNEAVRLIEDLICAVEPRLRADKNPDEQREAQLLLDDLVHFLPLLHTRSAPLKPIFEHIRLVWRN